MKDAHPSSSLLGRWIIGVLDFVLLVVIGWLVGSNLFYTIRIRN